MKESNTAAERDEVLYAFHQECVKPTAEQITAWVRRFPQYADDIRAHAGIARDWAAQQDSHPEEIDVSLTARAYSQALNIIYNEEHPNVAAHAATPGQTFHQMLGATGKEVYQLARELDIDRGVLADLFNGWMLPPACKRLADQVAASLKTTLEAFEAAMRFAVQHPYLGHAKADKVPTVKPRSCEAIIRSSNMSEERKLYWLAED
jgi:hypothetical protein